MWVGWVGGCPNDRLGQKVCVSTCMNVNRVGFRKNENSWRVVQSEICMSHWPMSCWGGACFSLRMLLMCEWRMVTQTCGGIELQKSTNMHVLPECIYTMLPRYNSGNILMLPFSSYKPACDTLGLPNDRVTIRCLVCILGSTRLLEAFYKNGPVFLQGQHGKQKDLCKSQGAFYRLFQFANLGSHVNLYRCFWKNLWWSQVVTGDNRRRKHYHTTSYT